MCFIDCLAVATNSVCITCCACIRDDMKSCVAKISAIVLACIAIINTLVFILTLAGVIGYESHVVCGMEKHLFSFFMLLSAIIAAIFSSVFHRVSKNL